MYFVRLYKYQEIVLSLNYISGRLFSLVKEKKSKQATPYFFYDGKLKNDEKIPLK